MQSVVNVIILIFKLHIKNHIHGQTLQVWDTSHLGQLECPPAKARAPGLPRASGLWAPPSEVALARGPTYVFLARGSDFTNLLMKGTQNQLCVGNFTCPSEK